MCGKRHDSNDWPLKTVRSVTTEREEKIADCTRKTRRMTTHV